MENETQKISTKCLLFIVIVYILVFQDFIQNYISVFQYADELLALFVFPIVIIRIKKTRDFKIKKNHLILIVLLAIITAIGIYSNITFKYQEIKFVLSDLLVFLKFFMAYFLSNMLFDEEFIKSNIRLIRKNIKFIIYFLFVCTMLNYAFKIWPGADIRYGIPSNKLFYGHPTTLAGACIFLLALLELTGKNKKIEFIPLICVSMVLVSTFRLKALAAVLLDIIIIIYLHKTGKKITTAKVIALGIIAIILTFDQIVFYFVEVDSSARKQLLVKSFQIMKDFFPIGTGFATFGSYFSAVSYSPVYYNYGLNNSYGLTPASPVFVSDCFWPMIFGQFGVIGAICYAYCVILIFKNIQAGFSKDNIETYSSKLICLIYLLISSTSESAFVHPISIPLALILGIKVCLKTDNNKDEKASVKELNIK